MSVENNYLRRNKKVIYLGQNESLNLIYKNIIDANRHYNINITVQTLVVTY